MIILRMYFAKFCLKYLIAINYLPWMCFFLKPVIQIVKGSWISVSYTPNI